MNRWYKGYDLNVWIAAIVFLIVCAVISNCTTHEEDNYVTYIAHSQYTPLTYGKSYRVLDSAIARDMHVYSYQVAGDNGRIFWIYAFNFKR